MDLATRFALRRNTTSIVSNEDFDFVRSRVLRVSSSIPRYPIGLKSTVASHVAFTSQPLIVDDVTMDDRFPKGIAKSDSGKLWGVHERVEIGLFGTTNWV